MPLSKPNKAATVQISLQQGSLKIIAWDKAAVEYKAEGGGWIADSEEQNEVLIKVEGKEEVKLIVYVPRHCHLIVKSLKEGPIEIREVEGTLEVDAYNGSVKLTEVGGNAIVSSWNGPIFASFKYVNDKAMAFTSYEGEIKLLLPHDTNANILASYDNGSLINDFAPVKTAGEEGAIGTQEVEGNRRWEELTLGKGGPEWRVLNLNGNVMILKW